MSMLSTLLRGKRRGVSPVAAPANPMTNRAGLVGVQGEQMNKAFDYDPTPAVNRFAQGAWGSISEALGEQLKDLSGKAVGQGRFDSGFYNEDQGTIVRGGMRDFGNAMARTAVDAEGMRLGEVREGRELLMSRRGELENNHREDAERKRRKKRGIASAIGGALGAAAGSFAGPGGAMKGWGYGSQIGGAFG